MKILSKPMKWNVLGLAILACLVAGGANSSYGIPPNQVFVQTSPQTFTGGCCFSWGETVKITEPATPMPVIVSWSTDYSAGLGFFVGLMINGGPCQFYGPHALVLTATGPEPLRVQSRSLEWVVMPGDGSPATALHSGTNTFTLCGGGMVNATQTINLGLNNLAARISK